MAKRCLGCMKMKENSPVCEHCGYNENVPNYPHQLPIGTVLRGQYTVGKVLGQGGFGITYIGWDNFLDVPVAIKEFYPSSFVNRDCSVTLNVTCNGEQAESLFAYNRERFLREAKILAKLQNIPGIVKVQNLFTENNTAYIVMEYVKGIDLKHYIRMQGRVLTPQETFSVLRPIMYALQKVHEADLVHRDISPDNIMILPDGSAKLLDFGAAREVEHAEVDKELPQSTEAILKHGFAPLEQYRRRGNLGPWTDVYALCATIFYCLTGRVPNSATERILEDDNVNWHQIPGLNEQQIAALEQGMALMPKQRTRSVRDLWDGLFGQSRSSFTQRAAPEPPKPDPAEEQKRQREMEEQRLRQEQERLKQEQERLKQEQLEQKRLEQERRAQEKLEKQRQEAEQREQQRLRQQQLQEEKRQQKLRQEQEKRQQQELQRQQKLEEKQRRQQNQEKKAFGKVLIPILAVICVMLTVFVLKYRDSSPQPQSPDTTPAGVSSDPVVRGPVTLHVLAAQYGSKTAQWWAGFEADFEAANENIDLVVDVVSWNDIYTNINARIAAGEAPDILNIDVYEDYQKDGLLLPIGAYLSEKTRNDFYPQYLDYSAAEGEIWAVPDLTSVRAMYINMDILKEIGADIPATWEELRDVCQKIRTRYGQSVHPWGVDMTTDEGQACFAYYTFNNGGGFLDESGNWAVNSPENIEAIEFIVDMFHKGLTNPDPAIQTRYELQDLFASGKLAMMIAPNTLSGQLDGAFQYAVAPIPNNTGSSKALAVMDRLMCFDNSQSEDELAAITLFFDFFYEAERYSDWVEMEGFLPATVSGAQAMAAADTALAPWQNIIGTATFYPHHKAEWADVKQAIIDTQQKAMLGQDVKQNLDRIQEDLPIIPALSNGPADPNAWEKNILMSGSDIYLVFNSMSPSQRDMTKLTSHPVLRTEIPRSKIAEIYSWIPLRTLRRKPGTYPKAITVPSWPGPSGTGRTETTTTCTSPVKAASEPTWIASICLLTIPI